VKEGAMGIMLVLALALFVAVGGGFVFPPAAEAQPAKSGTPAAEVGDEVITQEELEQALAPQLARIEQQRFQLLEQKLDELIGDRLVAQEAKKRGMSVEQLLKAEVYAKAPEVADAEVANFIAQNRARLPQGDEAEIRLKVWDYLRSQKVAQRRQAYVQGLRGQAKVSVYIEEPAAARVAVSTDRGFTRGPKEAPVAMVEFSDYQCPFCKRVLSTIKQITDTYPGKVKWVFRDFPIVSLHPTAPKAHEAARCAGEQGKFWEYHDLLFERSPRHSPQELKQYAQDLKLDGSVFAQCLDSGRYQAQVNSDIEEGTRLGVTGTPTFFLNGRLLVGAQPFAEFQRLIESELARKAAR
jgi:protein-disulfide isomerase